jgi:hypothetical protein
MASKDFSTSSRTCPLFVPLKDHAQSEGISIVDRLSGQEEGGTETMQLHEQSSLSSATLQFTRSQRNRVFEEAGLFAHGGEGIEEEDEGSEFSGVPVVAGGLEGGVTASPRPAPSPPRVGRPPRPLEEEYAGLTHPLWNSFCTKALAFTRFSSMFGDAAAGGPLTLGAWS